MLSACAFVGLNEFYLYFVTFRSTDYFSWQAKNQHELSVLSLFKYQPNHNPHLLFGYLQRGTAREFFFHSHNQLIDGNLSMFSFRIFNQNTSCKLCCYGYVLCMPCTKPNRQFTIGENSIQMNL